MKILARSYTYFNRKNWELVFRFGSFTGLNFWSFFSSGKEGGKYWDVNLYRHPRIGDLFEQSVSVAIKVTRENATKVSDSERWFFEGIFDNNLTTWFSSSLFKGAKNQKDFRFFGGELFSEYNFLNIGSSDRDGN